MGSSTGISLVKKNVIVSWSKCFPVSHGRQDSRVPGMSGPKNKFFQFLTYF